MADDQQMTLYEYPFGELTRRWLRLDYLWQRLGEYNTLGGTIGTHGAVGVLLEILAVTARSDTRGEILKELDRLLLRIRKYQDQPGVDSSILRNVLTRLLRCRDQLDAAGSNFLQPLRDSEFLANIGLRINIPGGACAFDLPDYHHWLSRPREVVAAEMEVWVSRIRPLCEAIKQVLWIIREDTQANMLVAMGGMYEVHTNGQSAHLIRIFLPTDSELFPQVSGNNFRCNIHFLRWTGLESRPVQTEEDVQFRLAICT